MASAIPFGDLRGSGSASERGLIAAVLDSLPDAVVVVGPEGQVELANRQAEIMSGYSNAELLGQQIELLVPDRHRAQHLLHRDSYHASEPVRRGMGSGIEISFRRKDGSEFPVDIALSPIESGGVTHVVAAIRDITDRRRAEDELRDSRERFGLLVEGVTDYAIFMLDSAGNIASWNQGATAIKGYAAEEIIGRHFSVFYSAEDVRMGLPDRELESVRETGRGEYEGWRVRKDGSRFWASVVLTALHDQGGALRGFAKVTRDSTERKRFVDRLQAVLGVTEKMLQGGDVAPVLELIARQATSLAAAQSAAILVPGPGPDEVTVAAASGVGARRLRGRRQPVSESAAGLSLSVPFKVGNEVLGRLVVRRPKGGRAFLAAEVTLLQTFATQAAAALEYARIRERLQQLAVAEDRERIGRELHDGSIQSLFAVGMGLQAAAERAEDPELRKRLDSAVDQIDDVIRDLRNYIFGLRPGLLADRALDQALRHLAADFESKSGVTTLVEVDPAVGARLAGIAGDIIQLVGEALSNIGRHARAATCRVRLVSDAEGALLEIEDDGAGFDSALAAGMGQGLRNLGERVANLKGKLEIDSRLGEGTRIGVRIP